MFSHKLLATAAICAVLATPALSQTTTPTPAPNVVSPPATPLTMGAPALKADHFYYGEWMPTHWRTSDAIGQAVYNNANEKVGDIEDVLIDGEGRVLAAIIGVGGFLGMGEHKVAITYKSFQMSRDAAGKSRLVVDFDKATLQNAPRYKPTDAIKRP